MTHTLAIFVDHGIKAHIPRWSSQQKLSNCIIQHIQFLIMYNYYIIFKVYYIGLYSKISTDPGLLKI